MSHKRTHVSRNEPELRLPATPKREKLLHRTGGASDTWPFFGNSPEIRRKIGNRKKATFSWAFVRSRPAARAAGSVGEDLDPALSAVGEDAPAGGHDWRLEEPGQRDDQAIGGALVWDGERHARGHLHLTPAPWQQHDRFTTRPKMTSAE